MRVFIGAEEERAILLDRSANDAAELIAMIIRARRSGPVCRPTVSVEIGVPEEVVAVAVELVGAGFSHHVHDCAARLRVLRPEEVRLHLELLDRIDRRRPFQISRSGVLFGDIDNRSVHQHVRSRVASAIGDEVGITRVDSSIGADHAGSQVQGHERIPPDIGERHHVPVLDDLA